MALEDELRDVAREIADCSQAHLLESEYELAKAEIGNRLINYLPRVGPDFQCPRCWIQHEKRSALLTVRTDIDDDVFRCGACHLELVF
jgi:hypothetical protein